MFFNSIMPCSPARHICKLKVQYVKNIFFLSITGLQTLTQTEKCVRE